jgi:general secretion pathway protein H
MISRSSWKNVKGLAAGFTLIEILVVLVILGLALSIVAGFVPSGRGTLELAGASDEVAQTLRQARAQAIARQQPVVFSLVAAGHGYQVGQVVRMLPSNLVASIAGPAVIRFASDGSSSGGVLRLGEGGRVQWIIVDWLTGRVTRAGTR